MHDGSRDVIDDLQMDHRSKSVLPVVNTIQEQTTNDEAGDLSKDEAYPSPEVNTDDETCHEDDRI